MWLRWNISTHIYEQSTNDGASWVPLALSADAITEGALAKARQHAQTVYRDDATQNLSFFNGQIVFPAAANVSANANTLDDYEEGSWTPVDASSAALTFTYPVASTYVKIGRLVLVTFAVLYPTTASAIAATIGGLPFSSDAQYGGNVFYTTYTATPITPFNASGNFFNLYSPTLPIANSALSGKHLRHFQLSSPRSYVLGA